MNTLALTHLLKSQKLKLKLKAKKVAKMLRAQLKKMADDKLRKALHPLRAKIAEFHSEIVQLKSDNEELRAQLSQMNSKLVEETEHYEETMAELRHTHETLVRILVHGR
jgi:uncharacterized coiled-coil DUF342 family protein